MMVDDGAKCEAAEATNAASDLEAIKAKEELLQFQAYVDEATKRLEWKKRVRSLIKNMADRPDESELHKLDSSLKKNTAFVRKLKTSFSEGQKPSILKDVQSLNLTKYIGEVASAVVEAKLKMSDTPAMVDLCAELHQRYVEFAPSLLEAWQRTLKTTGNSKLRVDLKLYADLITVGIFPLKDSLSLLGSVLMNLVQNDREQRVSISIIITFCKMCGDDFAGLSCSRKMRLFAQKHCQNLPKNEDQILPPDKQKNVRQLLKDYYASVCKRMVQDHRELTNLERTNRRILLTKGEVHEERKKKLETLNQTFNKLEANAQQLADLLDEDLPVLIKEEDDDMENAAANADEDGMGADEQNLLGGLWEDEETKSFYENLVDLQAIVPAILYKDSKGSKEEQEVEQEADLETVEDLEEEPEDDDDDDDVAPPNIDDDADETETINPSTKMILDAFLANLPNCVNREMIDTAAVDFCMKLNTKINRRKLVKALFSVHRNRQDLLPFYGRFVATLNPCMPELSTDLAHYLKQEFRWQLRKKDQMKIESKLKVCRFIGELVKFNVFPKAESLFCLKQLLFDFSHHHIEMACTLMDTCGRFLYRSPDSHRRTKIYLEQMMRKKLALSLDARYIMMIENAFYSVNPPSSQEEAKQIRKPPLHEYVDKLLYTDLCRSNTEKILKQIRKLHWNDEEEAAHVVKCLGAVWNYKYYNIRYAASLLAGLVGYHEWIGPQIVDDILEHVRAGMEMCDAKYNQRRMAVARFVGELYNYRLVDSGVVFKVLYSLITFGTDETLDPPDHMLRLRLVCVILDTCGMFFNSGSSKKKLDYFFIYFQRYYWRKKSSPWWKHEADHFPMAIANIVDETCKTLRPKMVLPGSLEEAEKAVKDVEREMMATIREKAPDLAQLYETSQQGPTSNSDNLETIAEESEAVERSEEDEGDEDEEDEDDDEEDESYMEEDDDISQEDDKNSQEDTCEDEEDEDEDEDEDEEDEDEEEEAVEIEEGMEDLLVPSAPKFVACEEDDEFVNLFDKMVNENLTESRTAVPRSQQVSVVAPVHMKHAKKTYNDLQNTEGKEETVQFAVLMRKGTKQTYKELAVPVDSDIAMNLQRQEEANRREKERVKQLTLEINERQEEEDLNDAIAMMQRPSLVNVNRERRQRPPKGTPDADAIFGSKRGSNR